MEAYLTRVCPEKNEYRFYSLLLVRGLFGNWGIQREWGRIGRRGTFRKTWFDTETEALADLNRLILDKKKRGYALLTVEATEASVSA